MSDFERMIDSMIKERLEPLEERIEELKKQLLEKNEKEYLTSKDVKEVYGISRMSLWRYHNERKIKKYLIGEKVFFKKSEVEGLLVPC